MRKIKFGFICILAFIILSLSGMRVYAASGIKAILENDKTELTSGDEVVVTLRFDNYEEINKGVNAYKATLEYDKSIFEEVLESDFQTLNNWEQLKFNKDTGEFVAIKRVGSKTPEEIVKITLRVKENVQAGKEDILIKDIVTSEGKEDIMVGESKITVDIIQDQSNQVFIPGDQNSSNNVDNENNSLNPDNSIDGDLTQTGDTSNYMLWFALIAIEAIIIFVYIKKDKLKKFNFKNKKMIMILIIAAISLQTIGTATVAASSFSSKGEVNGDGQIDYRDIELLELFLIHQGELSESGIKNGDMNSDGSITVTDLTLLVRKVEKNLNYEVVLFDVGQDNYYPYKNEEVNLTFLGDVSYNAIIEKVIINNNEYEVKKVENSNIYTVNVGSNNTSGIKEYHFTEVLLNNGKRIDGDYTIKLDVLKDVPSIEGYTVNEDINQSKVYISFYLKDHDNSIESANIEILNESQQLIQMNEISAGKNEIEVVLEYGKKYTVNFAICYDLDTNQLIEHDEKHTGMLLETKELELVMDYQWQISDIAAYKNGLQTNTFDKNEPIQLRFNSSNATSFEPSFAVVNGKEYPVTKENQQYVVTVDGIDQAGKTDINLEEVVLSNGKRFPLTQDNIIPVTILKQKLEVADIDIKEDVENGRLIARFDLIDEDNALKSATIVLLDENNQEIAIKEVNAGKLVKRQEVILRTVMYRVNLPVKEKTVVVLLLLHMVM